MVNIQFIIAQFYAQCSLFVLSFIEVSLTNRTKVHMSWEDPLEEGMAPHSSTLVWKISWTEEPGRLQSMGSLGVGHD